jgi:hypothetical protein
MLYTRDIKITQIYTWISIGIFQYLRNSDDLDIGWKVTQLQAVSRYWKLNGTNRISG